MTHSAVAVPGAGSVLAGLTSREQAVLALMAAGMSNQGISRHMFLSPKTVEAHIGAVFTKLGLLPEADENRRVLAVLCWLSRTGDDLGRSR
jgi:DNA-binding NarL/FixJ family response regulator